MRSHLRIKTHSITLSHNSDVEIHEEVNTWLWQNNINEANLIDIKYSTAVRDASMNTTDKNEEVIFSALIIYKYSD
jgi:hypothetical protein